MIYIVIFILSYLLCLLYTKVNPKQKYTRSSVYILATIPSIILSAIRYDVGTDFYKTYVVGFYVIKGGGEVYGYDALFALFNKILLFFTDNSQWVFVWTSIIIGFFIFKSIKKMSVNAPLSFALYFISGLYFMSLNQVKQFLAMSILLYSLSFYIKEDWFWFICLLLIAFFIHNIILVILIPILLLYIREKWDFLMPRRVFFMLVLFIVFINVFYNFFIHVMSFTRFFERYMDSDYYMNANFSYAYMLFNLPAFVLFAVLYNKNKHDNEFVLFYIFKFVALMFVVLSSKIAIAPRIADTLLIVDIISIPYLFQKLKEYKGRYRKFKIAITSSIEIIYCAYFVWSFFVKNNHNVFPYQTIFGL